MKEMIKKKNLNKMYPMSHQEIFQIHKMKKRKVLMINMKIKKMVGKKENIKKGKNNLMK
jgi:hypothetical protein